MGILPLDEHQRKDVEALAHFAERPENLYLPGFSTWIPGDRPEFVRRVGTYRVVFSITQVGSDRRRHLTISCPDARYPNPVTVWTIATWCGFTGGKVKDGITMKPGQWAVAVDKNEHCLVVQEKLPIGTA